MNSETLEMTKVFNLLIYITDHFHAVGDAKFHLSDPKDPRIEITVDEGGKTIYAATLEIDSPALEAKARLVRFELEQMIEECSLPILWERVA